MPSTLVMLLNGNPTNLLINVAPLQVYDLAGVFFHDAYFPYGTFLAEGTAA